MGLNFLNSSSSYDCPDGNTRKNKNSVSMFDRWKKSDKSNNVNLPNPRPDNYTLLRSEVLNGYLIIELKYHDCTNYEGRKIMVYKCTLNQLMKQRIIDPHFCNNSDYFSPIARFEPTENGWKNACLFVNIL